MANAGPCEPGASAATRSAARQKIARTLRAESTVVTCYRVYENGRRPGAVAVPDLGKRALRFIVARAATKNSKETSDKR